MKNPTEGLIVKTEFGLGQITKTDTAAKSVRVKHFTAKTAITDFRFCDVLSPDLTNSEIKAILRENKIVAKVSGVFEKRIDVKKESDMLLVTKLFPTYCATYGLYNK